MKKTSCLLFYSFILVNISNATDTSNTNYLKNNIEFVSIEPKKMIAFVDNKESGNIKKNDNLSNIVIDPLLVEGTKKFLIDVSFKTDFVSLLSFLRELEFQENLILLDDINLKLG